MFLRVNFMSLKCIKNKCVSHAKPFCPVRKMSSLPYFRSSHKIESAKCRVRTYFNKETH